MKRSILYIAVSLAVIIGAGALVITSQNSESPAEIYIEENALVYHGDINEPSYEKLKMMMDENPGIKTLEIRSLGGDTIAGKKIARMIFEEKLNVAVDTICFSSCANYIFPSGAQKFILEDGIVGWHGSELQFEVLAEIMDKPAREIVKEMVLEESQSNPLYPTPTEEQIEEIYQTLVKDQEDEIRFFEMINVDIDVTLNGLRHIVENEECIGWAHSIEDMNMYGINDVFYLSEESYPDESALSEYGLCLI